MIDPNKMMKHFEALDKELLELRAFKAACEGQEAVAVADGSFNHQCAQGVFLYEHPDPQAAELRMRVAELEAQLANLAFTAGQASKVSEALRHAAKVVELFDDATWADCYMIDSADCAWILEGLVEYYESTAAPSQETGE
jgi:hypothetical protein